MRSTKVIVIFTVLVAALAVCGCAAGPPEPSKPSNKQLSSAVEKVNGISVSLRSEPAVTNPGGTFSLTLVIRNLSGKAATYDLKNGQLYDFIAFQKGGGEVWRWSQGVMFTQALNPVTLEPGASEVYKVAWNTGSTAPGLYTIQGYFTGLPDVRPAVSVEITGG
jgi:Intracellular proteinase inhibitor